MNKIPTWAKVVGAILVIAFFVGGARLLLWFDQMGGSSKFGLD